MASFGKLGIEVGDIFLIFMSSFFYNKILHFFIQRPARLLRLKNLKTRKIMKMLSARQCENCAFCAVFGKRISFSLGRNSGVGIQEI